MVTHSKKNGSNPMVLGRSFSPFLGFHRAVNEAMKDFYDLFDTGINIEQSENRNLFPALDVVEAKDHFTIELEMPGMGEEDIQVAIQANRLIIKGEKSSSKKHEGKQYLSREIQYGSYERSVDLPLSADLEKASASFKKGMLWVNIPKKAESKPSSRKIKVQKI